MTSDQRRSWLVVVSLFLTLFFIFGSGYNTAGVFFTPVISSFGWSRTRLSSLQTALALAAGVVVPVAGWLLDRFDARLVMAVGAATAGLGFITAGEAHSYGTMIAAYVLIGVGLGAATLMPASMVVANWFDARRGLAMGLTMTGTSVGGMVMTLISDRAIRTGGWRFGYLVLAMPVFLIVIPLILIIVRTRPPTGNLTVAQASGVVPGLEVGAAVRSRSFWLIAAALLLFGFSVSGANLHTVPYLIGIGYRPARAAFALSLILAIGAVGKLAMGWVADRIGGRLALCASLVGMALGLLLLMGARRPSMLVAFIAVYGFTVGAPLALAPIVMAESLGLKRFGSLFGLAGIFHTAGAALGPLAAGRIFDLNASYSVAFELFIVMLTLGACAIVGCVPLSIALPELEQAAARA